MDKEVWRQTIEERDKGWLRGPIDFSVNDTVNVYEAPVLHTVDVACVVLTYLVFLCKGDLNRSNTAGSYF